MRVFISIIVWSLFIFSLTRCNGDKVLVERYSCDTVCAKSVRYDSVMKELSNRHVALVDTIRITDSLKLNSFYRKVDSFDNIYNHWSNKEWEFLHKLSSNDYKNWDYYRALISFARSMQTDAEDKYRQYNDSIKFFKFR